jgi:L-ascorbate metabolism protein UlaG (beta-lactamase superfamily)
MIKKKRKNMLIGILIFMGLIIVGIWGYLQHPKFGKLPSGERLERILKSPNYKDGQFQNVSPTPGLVEGTSVWKVYYEFIFKKFPETNPIDTIPSVKTDLKNLNPDENVMVWFGHSSYFIQINGKKFLVDPVLSGNASPVPNTNRSFMGSEIYTVSDLPDIDFMLITHDHYDHLDYETMLEIKPKVKKVITGLGVGEHLEYWGFKPEIMTELDWNESIDLGDNQEITVVPARHFSGRTFKRNTSLWVAFVLKSGENKMFLGGDSGYDSFFKEIGEKHGPFDWAILENGQYNEKWRYIHFLPEEAVQAAIDLQTKRFIPVHNSKFKLAQHTWREPMERITKAADDLGVKYATPKVGEKLNLKDSAQVFDKWWTDLK